MVKLAAGILIVLTIVSVPLWGMVNDYGIVPVLIGVFITSLVTCSLLLALHLIFKGLEELEKKKK